MLDVQRRMSLEWWLSGLPQADSPDGTLDVPKAHSGNDGTIFVRGRLD